MSWVAVAVGVGSAVVGGVAQNNAANKSAKATQQGAQATIDEQRREFDQARADQKPWLDTGAYALDLQKNYLAGDTSGFMNSPDYKFAVEQGFKGLERGHAANSNYYSGGADADRIALGQGLATQYAGNYWAKLAGLSGTGQNSAQNLGALGANAANQIGNAYGNAASARASAYTTQGQNYADLANQFGQYGMYAYRNRNPGT